MRNSFKNKRNLCVSTSLPGISWPPGSFNQNQQFQQEMGKIHAMGKSKYAWYRPELKNLQKMGQLFSWESKVPPPQSYPPNK